MLEYRVIDTFQNEKHTEQRQTQMNRESVSCGTISNGPR